MLHIHFGKKTPLFTARLGEERVLFILSAVVISLYRFEDNLSFVFVAT